MTGKTKPSFNSRKLHRWGALLCAAPILLIIVTGILIQLKDQFEWIQPKGVKGHTPAALSVPFDKVLEAVKTVPAAEVSSWKDVLVVDGRPAAGVLRVRTKNGYEVQVDGTTGEVLHSGIRRTSLLMDLHEGGWFGHAVRYWIFIPAAFILLGLWLTGLIMYFQPLLKRRKNHVILPLRT